MNYLEELERMLARVRQGLDEAEIRGLFGTEEYTLMCRQEKVLQVAVRKMRKLNDLAEELIGGRRTEKLTCEDPEAYKKARR